MREEGGQNGKHKLEKVRKGAVGDWLKFLSQHHKLLSDTNSTVFFNASKRHEHGDW